MIWNDDTLKLRPAPAGAPLRVGLWLPGGEIPAWVTDAIERLRASSGLAIADHSSEAGVDVIVWLGDERPAGPPPFWPKFGVWRLFFGDPSQPCRAPAYFWEVYRGNPTTVLVLVAHHSTFDRGAVLYRYVTATRMRLDYTANCVEPLSMAPVILHRRLLDAQEGGLERLKKLGAGGEIDLPRRGRRPGLLDWIWFALRAGVARVRRGWLARKGEPKWFVCYRTNQELFTRRRERFSPDDWREIPNPPGSTLADPFPIEHQGRRYLLVEEIVTETSRAHISFCEIPAEGPPAAPQPALRPNFHLSYPCPIQWDGQAFLLPETADNRTVELYRAVDFPRVWQLEKVLQQGVILVDTTPFEQDGIWYFFSTTIEEVSGFWLETWLFWSDRLDGEWRYHPANPICSDVRRARGAGRLFRRNGRLIRPSQDCSVCYGYAIALNEVLVLSPTEYQERPAEVIPPNWRAGIFATHTLNASDSLEVIDATKIPRP